MQLIDRPSVGEIVREMESDFVHGTTQQSKYVEHSLHNTLERITAYLNSTHISGLTDSKGRLKPFSNIVVAAANIWFRATDIDRKHIRIRATKKTDWINSFLGTIHLRAWMRKSRFGVFLNKWGRTLARYGSAVVKFVERDGELMVMVVPWSKMICDAVDFENNIKIEILELTEAQLRRRVETHGYDADQIEGLMNAHTTRKTRDKQNKDTKDDYFKLYELHGELPESLIDDEGDENTFVQQMHVISMVGTNKGRKVEYEDFTLVKGREKKDPYMITHLIEEDDRTLAIGAVEHLFEAQWMVNHTTKQIKDQLDLASKLVFQTSDPNFQGMNMLSAIVNGQILTHAPNQPLTALSNQSHDTEALSNFRESWKSLGNEIVSISESMLGAQPKSGTAWRQTEALLSENYSMFELMTENKGLALEDMLREWIIPHIKKKMDTSEEVSATLAQHEIDKIDSLYIKSFSTSAVNQIIKDKMIKGEILPEEETQIMLAEKEGEIRESLKLLGDQRFFKPSDISDKTWKEQFEGMEWDVEVDITGEAKNVQETLTTLSTALKVMMTPGFNENPKAQATVREIFELTGAMSPVQYDALPSPVQVQGQTPDVSGLQKLEETKEKNIK